LIQWISQLVSKRQAPKVNAVIWQGDAKIADMSVGKTDAQFVGSVRHTKTDFVGKLEIGGLYS
jgi:hypothetical protein